MTLTATLNNAVITANTNIYSKTIIDGVTIGDQGSYGLELINYPYAFAAQFINCKFSVRKFGLHVDNPSGKFGPTFTRCEFTKNDYGSNNTIGVYIQCNSINTINAFITPQFNECIFDRLRHAVGILPFFGIHEPKFEYCEFRNSYNHAFTNLSTQIGGGIGLGYSIGIGSLPCPSPYDFKYTPIIHNSIFYNNAGILDATVWFNCTTTDIATKFTSCTFFNNTAFNKPAFSIENHLHNNPNMQHLVGLELENCISYGNAGTGSLMRLGASMAANITHSMIEASSCNSNGTSADPLFQLIGPHSTQNQVIDLGGNIYNQNPQFLSSTPAINLDLAATSPARNAGVPPGLSTPTMALDFLGRTRINESIIDMGAYEYCPSQNSCYPTSPMFKNNTLETTEEPSIVVYPNPFSDELSIKRTTDTKAQIMIYDVRGILLLNEPISSYETSLDMTNYSSGIYTIILVDANTSTTRRVIKK